MEGDVWLDGPEDSFLVVDEAGGDGAGDEGGSGAQGGDADGAADADGAGDDTDGTGQNLEFLLDEGSAGGSLPATQDEVGGGSGADGTGGDGVDPSGWSNDATLDALLDAAERRREDPFFAEAEGLEVFYKGPMRWVWILCAVLFLALLLYGHFVVMPPYREKAKKNKKYKGTEL